MSRNSLTFCLELPQAEPNKAAAEQAPKPPTASTAAANRALTVLYIEDNLANLRLIDAVLARLPNVTLLTAMQGRLGVELATEHQPDLVLLDVHLPDINGDEVLTMLRAQPATEKTHVVFLSADATPEHVDRLTALGADGYLTKPIDIAELLRIVNRSRRAD